MEAQLTSNGTFGQTASRARTQLRAGIIGDGFIAGVHANAVRTAGGELVGVVARTPEKTQAAVSRFGARRSFASLEEMVASPDIDVIHICTPNATHKGYAETAISAGKHVICEKPLAITSGDAQTLTVLAKNAGVIATVPFVYRYHPTVIEARERIFTGSCGDVRLIHGSYLQDWMSSPDDKNWRTDSTLGGRISRICRHWRPLVRSHRICNWP